MIENDFFRFFKLVVKETFGGNRTYFNQLYLLEEISHISDPITNKKLKNNYKDNLRSDSPNLMISNLSDNKGDNYLEDEETNNVLPKFDEKKYSYMENLEEEDSYRNANKKQKVHGINYHYENEISNLNDRNFHSEIDYRNEKNKLSEYDCKIIKYTIYNDYNYFFKN